MVNDFCSRYQPNPLNLFLASLDHVLGNLKSQHGYEQIKTALVTVAQALEKSSKRHLILSSDRLTFQLGNESFSLPLTSESIIDVLAWPNEIVERLPELSASNQSQLRQAPAWK
jgi:5'-3' exonuclease